MRIRIGNRSPSGPDIIIITIPILFIQFPRRYSHWSYLPNGVSHRCSHSWYRRWRRTRRVRAVTISALNCDPESRADFTCWRARARASTTTNSWSRATSTSPAGKRLVAVRAARRGRARLFRATSGRDRPRKPVSRRCRETLAAATSTDRRHLFSVVRTPEKRQMRFPRTKKKKKSSKKRETEVHPSSCYAAGRRRRTKRNTSSCITRENARYRSL